jgi:translation elongation factor EF-1alpha
MTHVVIRKDHKERNVPESNVMILGPSGVGKSSLMGRLTYGQKDDGNGFSRKLVLRHVHEKTSGNTSCLKYDTIGFAGDNVINYSIGIEFNMEHIYTTSDRLINLIDVPGDIVAYSKTIFYSVSSINPDHIIICIPCKCLKPSANQSTDNQSTDNQSTDNQSTDESITEDSEEYVKKNADIYKFILAVCIMYKIQPIFVLIKQDLMQCNDTEKNIYPIMASKIAAIFNSWRDEMMSKPPPLPIINEASASKDINKLSLDKQRETFKDTDTDEQSDTLDQYQDTKSDYVSIQSDFQNSQYIEVSNVTDYGYQVLIDKLSKIDIVKYNDHKQKILNKNKLFVINDVFTIPDTGTIFHGILRYGVINVDDIVNVLCHGVITKHKVKSIHRKTLDVDRLLPGESGSITFYGNINKIDKTATIIDAMLEKNVVLKAFVVSAFEYVKLKPRQYMLFVGNNIVAVILSPSIESDIIFEVSSFNDLGFMIDSEIGILKDERQNYFFIRFV